MTKEERIAKQELHDRTITYNMFKNLIISRFTVLNVYYMPITSPVDLIFDIQDNVSGIKY